MTHPQGKGSSPRLLSPPPTPARRQLDAVQALLLSAGEQEGLVCKVDQLEGSAWASGLSPSMGEEPRALKRPFCLLWTQSYFLPEPLVYVIPGAHSDSQNSDSLSFDGSCTKRFTSISPPSALGADRVCTQGLVRGGAARGWGEGATCQTRPG